MDKIKKSILSGQVKPISAEVNVTTYTAYNDAVFVFEAGVDGMDLRFFVASNKARIDELLTSIGAVLFRGFAVNSVEAFHNSVLGMGAQPIDYEFGSTPRTQVSNKIFTSTEYPSDQLIPMHNEMSYTDQWPSRIWFYCELQATTGGETPIVDSRKVYQEIPKTIRDVFERSGIKYVRNYKESVDVPWQKVFNTSDRKEVEAYCKQRNIYFEWNGNDLKTWQTCQASIEFKPTGEKVWFNQAHLFHYSLLPQAVQESILELYGEEGIPRNSYLGSGEKISPADIQTIHRAYEKLKIPVGLNKSEVMLLNNEIIGHGRQPYTGLRKVRVAMTK